MMNAILDMAKECLPIVTVVGPILAYAVKCLLSNPVDKVFGSKEKQLLSSVVKIIFDFVLFFLLYFGMGIMILQLEIRLALPTVTISEICYVIIILAGIVLIVGYLISGVSSRLKKWMQKKKASQVISWICFICYLGIAFSFLTLEILVLVSVTESEGAIKGVFWLSMSIAILVTLSLCIMMEWLQTISSTRVFINHEKYGKLYLLYAFDKKIILCKLEDEDGKQRFGLILKTTIEESIIYVEHGNGLTVTNKDGDDQESVGNVQTEEPLLEISCERNNIKAENEKPDRCGC